MEKNCINCKWYWSGKCHNKNLSITQENTTYWDIVNFIEEGVLSESIKEQFNLNQIRNVFLKDLNITAVKKKYYDSLFTSISDDVENELNECIDMVISKILLNYFKNNEVKEIPVDVKNPNEFLCNNWE